MIIDFLLSSVKCWSVISFLGWTLLDAVISLDEVWLEQDLSSLFSAFVSHLEKKKQHGCWSALSESRLFPSCCPFTLCITSVLGAEVQAPAILSAFWEVPRRKISWKLHWHWLKPHLVVPSTARESVVWSLSWEARHNEQST